MLCMLLVRAAGVRVGPLAQQEATVLGICRCAHHDVRDNDLGTDALY